MRPCMEVLAQMPDFGWRRDIRALAPRYYGKPGEPPLQAIADDPPRASRLSIANEHDFPIYRVREDFHACAASAVGAAIHLWRKTHDGLDPDLQPSVRFLYYVGRYVHCREQLNNGASIFATLRAAREIGYVPEDLCPLGAPGSVSWNEPPDDRAYAAAAKLGILDFRRVKPEHVTKVIAAG